VLFVVVIVVPQQAREQVAAQQDLVLLLVAQQSAPTQVFEYSSVLLPEVAGQLLELQVVKPIHALAIFVQADQAPQVVPQQAEFVQVLLVVVEDVPQAALAQVAFPQAAF
jgi:hypothetical protein